MRQVQGVALFRENEALGWHIGHYVILIEPGTDASFPEVQPYAQVIGAVFPSAVHLSKLRLFNLVPAE